MLNLSQHLPGHRRCTCRTTDPETNSGWRFL